MPGLDLKGVPVTSRSTQERTKKALDILAEIQGQMAAMGLQPYPQPKKMPEPLDADLLAGLSNRELETQLAAYTGYAAFLQTKLVEAQIAYKASSINLGAVKASLKASLFKDKVPKSEVDAKVNTAPEFIEHELEHLKLFAIKEILEAHYNAYSKQAATVSRVIELRKLEYEQETRSHNVASYKPRPGAPGGLPGNLRRR